MPVVGYFDNLLLKEQAPSANFLTDSADPTEIQMDPKSPETNAESNSSFGVSGPNPAYRFVQGLPSPEWAPISPLPCWDAMTQELPLHENFVTDSSLLFEVALNA